MVSSVDDIVLSIISLVANTWSVVDLFLRYAAWDMGITESNLELILYIIQTANIFLRTNKIIISPRFDVGPLGFPGICSALKIPCVISFGFFPVAAILLYISAIFSYTTFGEFFTSSTLIGSIPGLLLFFRVHTALLISDDANSVDRCVDNTFCIGVAFV